MNPLTPAGDVVAFWRAAGPGRWFARDQAFDHEFRERFLEVHWAAARRELDMWQASPDGALALVLLTDQFPRNAFRATAHMYATDALARHFAREAIVAGHPRGFEVPLRLFFCLPFAHSEELADQERSVELHRELGPDWMRDALGHRDIIRRFGRFPHRNRMYGRATTPAEQAFLDGGGFAG